MDRRRPAGPAPRRRRRNSPRVRGGSRAAFYIPVSRARSEMERKKEKSLPVRGRAHWMRLALDASLLCGLLFGAQLTYLAHAPQGVFSLFLRQKSEVADGMSGSAY